MTKSGTVSNVMNGICHVLAIIATYASVATKDINNGYTEFLKDSVRRHAGNIITIGTYCCHDVIMHIARTTPSPVKREGESSPPDNGPSAAASDPAYQGSPVKMARLDE